MATKSLGRVSIVPQGDYDESKVYKRLDLVKDDGKTYLSLKEDNINPLSDEDSWMLLTESGRFEDLTPKELETLTTSFGGDLVVSDNPQPTSSKWYFAKESGTYPNAGGLVVDLSSKLVILNYDGTTWSKVEVAMPSAELPLYSVIKSANIDAETQFIDDEGDFSVYYVLPGQTLNTNEKPFGNILKARRIWKNPKRKTLDINEEQGFITNANTVIINNDYPNEYHVKDFDVDSIDEVILSSVRVYDLGIYRTALGIKDNGEIVDLMQDFPNIAVGEFFTIRLNVSPYKFISFAVNLGYDCKLEVERIGLINEKNGKPIRLWIGTQAEFDALPFVDYSGQIKYEIYG